MSEHGAGKGSEEQASGRHRSLWLAFIPVVVFGALASVFLVGLGNESPQKVPSVLIGKPVPDVNLAAIDGLNVDGKPIPGIASSDLKSGTVKLVNVWASWCAPCRQEHPLLMKLAEDKAVEVVGINYKDKPENAKRFLGTLGNPYSRVGADSNGRSAVDWGVIAVPETFLVDKEGVIRYKWIGPLTPKAIEEELLPRIKSSQAK